MEPDRRRIPVASTKPDVSYVRLDSAQIWAAKDGTIHITSDDKDVKDFFHTYINNNPNSKRYHPAAYRQLARILTMFGKDVPGWDPATRSDPEGEE
jgi:hypothetical protein